MNTVTLTQVFSTTHLIRDGRKYAMRSRHQFRCRIIMGSVRTAGKVIRVQAIESFGIGDWISRAAF